LIEGRVQLGDVVLEKVPEAALFLKYSLFVLDELCVDTLTLLSEPLLSLCRDLPLNSD